MGRLRRFFYNNKNQILKVTGIIITVIVVIQILNAIAKNQLKNQKEEVQTIDYGKDVSPVTNERKNSDEYTKEKSILKAFTDYCNNKDYESAYSLLSDNCKEALYPNINIFIANYCNVKFASNKTCGFQLWNGNTYVAEIRDNIMATGEYRKEEYAQDYITIENNGKLNISNLIRRYKYNNKRVEEGQITIEMKEMQIYKEYTNIKVEVTNKTKNTVKLDTLENDKNIILKDDNNSRYYVSISDLTEEDVTIEPAETKQLNLKFFVDSREGLNFKELMINKIIANLEAYNQNTNYAYIETKIEM